MTRLSEARPQELLRAGAVFGQAADEVERAVLACRRSAQVRWVGPPSEQFQTQLGHLARDLDRIRTAYDEACDALLAYSRSLARVVEQAIEADRLDAHVDALFRARDRSLGNGLFYGPMTPEEAALRDRATYVRACAEQDEALAAGRLVTILDDLTRSAPHVSGWTRFDHAAARAADGAADQLRATAELAGSGLRSLPFLGTAASRSEARHELIDALKANAQPWLAVEDLLDQVRDGNGAYVLGQVSAGVVFRFRGARGRNVERFGAHDDMHAEVVAALRRGGHGDATLAEINDWVDARGRAQLVDALRRLEDVPLPDLDTLLADGVDLVHHEAAGGHTLLRHIGRDPDFLRQRQAWDQPLDPRPKSSFRDLDEAEAVVSDGVRANADLVRAWLARSGEDSLAIVLAVQPRVGLLIDRAGLPIAAAEVQVELRRAAGGRMRVHTAFLNP